MVCLWNRKNQKEEKKELIKNGISLRPHPIL